MYKGWKLLDEKERKHLSEQKVFTTSELEQMFEGQTKLRALGGSEPCWECRAIARKLGYPVTQKEAKNG